ncbi:MAG: RNA polymerase sigma factor SigJ [Rhodospirillaceae bacterium]|nr:RNA polymerase sigma factor SigJ [Rhodospirillaceae bacterium]
MSRSPESCLKPDWRLAAWQESRPRLIRLAYRFLGSVNEAEDIVQDAWLRFAEVDAVDDPAKYLSRIVTNLSLDRLRSAQHRREVYVGPWLPEPMLIEAGMVEDGDPSEAALDVSYAVMRALERLSPLERAALFLHDLFDVPFVDIGQTLGRTPAACRQLASRARKAIHRDVRRFPATERDVARFLSGWGEAVQTGSPAPLERILSEDVELVSDGGGKVPAARNILDGRSPVARFLLGIARQQISETAVGEPAAINGHPGLVLRENGVAISTMAFASEGSGNIIGVYIVRNPDKLPVSPTKAALRPSRPPPAAGGR